jgi:hypothetical protein
VIVINIVTLQDIALSQRQQGNVTRYLLSEKDTGTKHDNDLVITPTIGLCHKIVVIAPVSKLGRQRLLAKSFRGFPQSRM